MQRDHGEDPILKKDGAATLHLNDARWLAVKTTTDCFANQITSFLSSFAENKDLDLVQG